MGRENKNYSAVNQLYSEKQETEFLICHYLNQNMPLKMKKDGFFFEVNSGNQYDTHDLNLIKISPDRIKSEPIITIEYEYGANQNEWDLTIPRHKWQALNLMVRKKYGQNFSLFIKSSPTFNSLFAIDCRDNFVQKLVGKNIEVIDHNLDFETDDEAFRIYWDDVDKNTYVDDDKSRELKNNNICLIEDDPRWKLFYRFIWRRFLNKK